MKIIKKPDINDWKHLFECKGCQAELMAEAKDVICTYQKPEGENPGGTFFSVNCPICAEKFIIPDLHIPKIVRIDAVQRHNRDIDPY